MKNYDSYSEIDMGNCTVTFGIINGDGQWSYWDDTGWEFDVTKNCVIDFIEALDDNANPCTISKEILDEALEIADRVYWDNMIEGNI